MALQLIPMLIMGVVRLATPTVARALAKQGFKKAGKAAVKKAGNTAKKIKPQEVLKIVRETSSKSKPRNRLQALKNIDKPKSKIIKAKPKSKIIKAKPKSKIIKAKPKSEIIKTKPQLTKEQMVRTISDKPRPRLPQGQIPKPPSGKVPAVRTSGKQVPSGGKQVPAKLKKLPVATQQKIAKLGGLSGVKKGTALWKKLVGAGIIASSVAIPLLTDSKKTADATLKNKKKPPKAEERKSTAKTNNVLSKKRDKDDRLPPGAFGGKLKTPDYTPSRGIPKSTAKSLPAYFNNPIFKKLMDERGGREKFEPDNMWGKMSRFGRIGNDSTNQIMTEAAYKDLDEIENKTAAEEKLQSELYPIAMKRKGGGKVRKKKKKKQGYKSRKNESIAMRVKKKRTKKQLKASRNESYGKWGKGKGKGKVNKVFRRGGGKALRGFGKATYSNKLY